MNFEGRHFLAFARVVQDTEWPRGGCALAAGRSTVSRAYYAAFWAARRKLEDLGRGVSEGPGAHGEVISAFEALDAEGLEHCGEIADALTTLRRDRNRADYEPLGVPESEIGFSVEQAARILELLQRVR